MLQETDSPYAIDPDPDPEWARPDSTGYADLEAARKSGDETAKRAAQQAYQKLQATRLGELRQWWFDRMLGTPRPLQEKLALFWHGHFATGNEKVKNAYFMWRQNDLFRRLGNGNFEQLVLETGRDPAMLVWLDGATSSGKAPNENYARELMELFTLGEGHYTEDDIKNSAMAFSGWTINREAGDGAKFVPKRFANGEKTFKGRSGNWRDTDIVRFILEDPNCAEFMSRKLWTFFAYENPAPELVSALAALFRQNHYEIKPLLAAMFRSAEFYSPASVNNQIKSPVQWLVGASKALGLPAVPRFAPVISRYLGQDLFAPPNVKGWDGSRSWISTATLFLRCNVAHFLVYGGDPARFGIPVNAANPAGAEKKPPPEMAALEQKKHPANRNLLPPLVVGRLGADPNVGDAPLIETLAGRLYQSAPGPALTAACAHYLDRLKTSSPDEKIRGLVYFLMTRPEYQLA